MKIEGLKVMSDKGWTADSTYTADNGKVYNIPANHKYVCIDENGGVVNLTLITPAPCAYKEGTALPTLQLAGNVTSNTFGTTCKCRLFK